MNYRTLTSVLVSTVVATALLVTTGQAQDKVVLRHGSQHALTSFLGQQSVKLGACMSEATGGRLSVETFPSGQLGTGAEMEEALGLGTLDLHTAALGSWSRFVPELGVYDAPYVFKSLEDAKAATADGAEPWTTLKQRMIDEVGIRPLGMVSYGTRHMTANIPVYKPDDASQLRIRVFTQPIAEAYARTLGGIPVPVDWAEITTALATNVVQAQENPPESILAGGVDKLQDYMMLTGHLVAQAGLMMNESKFQSLSPEDQQVLLDCAHQLREESWASIPAIEAESLEKIRAELTVIEAADLDLAAFRQRAHDVVMEMFGNQWGELYEQMTAE